MPEYSHSTELKKIVISGIENEQTHAMAKKVLAEAYRRINHQVRFMFVPGRRSMELANEGKTDGEIARILGTELQFPNLIMVPTEVIRFKGVAFTKSVDREINSWDDLKGLKIGVILGVRYSTIGTKGLKPFFADSMFHLFKLLVNDRIDIAIAVLKAGKIELEKNFKNSGIHVIGSPLYSAPLYHFVHKKNLYLIKDLNQTFVNMKDKGEIDLILKTTFRHLLNDK